MSGRKGYFNIDHLVLLVLNACDICLWMHILLKVFHEGYLPDSL